MTEEKECEYCEGRGSWYGLAPHMHDMAITGSYLGSTIFLPKEEWEEWLGDTFFIPNFDPEFADCGMYICIACEGSGIHNDKYLETTKDKKDQLLFAFE